MSALKELPQVKCNRTPGKTEQHRSLSTLNVIPPGQITTCLLGSEKTFAAGSIEVETAAKNHTHAKDLRVSRMTNVAESY